MYCSLAVAINGKGFDNKALAWWITILHHICSVLELGTSEGPISVLPNYADVSLNASNMPSWASHAFNMIRRPMSKEVIKRRWTYLQASWIPTLKFYAMPHSLLSSMGDERPLRPYWPNPGENELDVIQRGITILTQGQAGTLPRIWASYAKVDGYNFSPKEDVKEAKRRKEIEEKNDDNATPDHEPDEMTQKLEKINTAMSPEPEEGKCCVLFCDDELKDMLKPLQWISSHPQCWKRINLWMRICPLPPLCQWRVHMFRPESCLWLCLQARPVRNRIC